MIDSQFIDLLGEDPHLMLYLHELTPLEVSFTPLGSSDEEKQKDRIFFDSQESERQLVNDGYPKGPGYAQAQAVSLPKRVSNTIFKTSLSQYRKSIIDELKADSSLFWLRDILSQVYGAKNLSVFPKLFFMVRQLGLQESITLRWVQRSGRLLDKKKGLMHRNMYPEPRYRKLEQTIKNMNKCLNQKEFEMAFEIYWGKYRQHTKHEDCKKDVYKFCKEFKKLVQQRKSTCQPTVTSSKISPKPSNQRNYERKRGKKTRKEKKQPGQL